MMLVFVLLSFVLAAWRVEAASVPSTCKNVLITAGLSEGVDILSLLQGPFVLLGFFSLIICSLLLLGVGLLGGKFSPVDPRSICFFGFELADEHTARPQSRSPVRDDASSWK
jgi:hypothetical protein